MIYERFFFAAAARPFRLFRYYFICKHSFVFRQTLYSPKQLLSCCWMMCNGVQKKLSEDITFVLALVCCG